MVWQSPSSFQKIKKRLALVLASQLSIDPKETENLLEKPKEQSHGHMALPVFHWLKQFKKPPIELSKEWANKLNKALPDFIKEVRSISGFMNFHFQPDFLVRQLETVFSVEDTRLASFLLGEGQHWIVDFASPNVAKHMNIGNFRASILGQVLVNLFRQFGFKVTALNHLGDWGTQFGRLLWAYRKWGNEYDFEKQPLDSLVGLYTRFHNESTQENLKEAAKLFQKLEKGDAELLTLWQKFVEISLREYEVCWKRLNVSHDLVLGESFYRDFLQDLKQRLKQKKLLQKSEGAEVVCLDEGPPCLIEKSDGASTYGARDLCSAIYRYEELKADRLIYITGSEQKLHFRQIFETLKKMEFPLAASCLHLSFGMYRFKGQGKMSTRSGHMVYLKDVLKEAVIRVKEIIEKRGTPLENKDKIAEQVGIGAVIFHDLMTDRVKDVDFEWDRILDFEGQSGPFVQYTHVRCKSLLRKYEGQIEKTFSPNGLSEEELKLAWQLLSFEEVLYQSFVKFKPHILAGYLLELSKGFNRFYNTERILNSPREKDKILLVEITRRVLKKGLSLLSIPLPETM